MDDATFANRIDVTTVRRTQGYYDPSYLRHAVLARIGQRIGECYPIEAIPDAIAKLLAQLDDPENSQDSGSRTKRCTPRS